MQEKQGKGRVIFRLMIRIALFAPLLASTGGCATVMLVQAANRP